MWKIGVSFFCGERDCMRLLSWYSKTLRKKCLILKSVVGFCLNCSYMWYFCIQVNLILMVFGKDKFCDWNWELILCVGEVFRFWFYSFFLNILTQLDTFFLWKDDFHFDLYKWVIFLSQQIQESFIYIDKPYWKCFSFKRSGLWDRVNGEILFVTYKL